MSNNNDFSFRHQETNNEMVEGNNENKFLAFKKQLAQTSLKTEEIEKKRQRKIYSLSSKRKSYKVHPDKDKDKDKSAQKLRKAFTTQSLQYQRTNQIQKKLTIVQKDLQQDLTSKDFKLYYKIYKLFLGKLSNLESRRKNRLEDKHYLIINDKANIDYVQEQIYQKEHQKRSLLQKCKFIVGSANKELLRQFDSIWPKVQHPKKPIIQFSTWIEILTIITILLFFTFYIFFTLENEVHQYLKFLGQIVFTLCPLFRLNCGYYRAGKFVDNRHEIIMRYVKHHMFYDICGNLAIFYTQIYEPQNWVERLPILPIFLKFKTLKLLVEDLQEKMSLTGTSVYIWQMFKLFVITWILCHVIGTMYHVVALAQHHFWGETNTWQHNMGIFDDEWYVRYIQSFYWAQSTIMLIGSKGETFTETVFAIISIFMTVGYFATILSSVEMVMNDMNAKTKKYRKDQEALNTFFKHNSQIKDETQSLVMNYLKYYYVGHKDMSAKENVNHIVSNFPKSLQDRIKNDRYSFFVDKFSFLKNNFSYHTLDAIPDIIQEEYYMPNQVIFKSRDVCIPKLYLILKGTVTIQNEFTDICQKNEMEYFGENQFFADVKQTYSVKSESFTTLLAVDRERFLKITKRNDKDFEAFHEIQHSYRTQNVSEKIKQTCYKCGENHLDSQCNMVNYNPNKNIIVIKQNHYTVQEKRQKFIRKKVHIKKKKTYADWEFLQYDQNQVLLNDDLEPYIRQIQQIQQVSYNLNFNNENESVDLNSESDEEEEEQEREERLVSELFNEESEYQNTDNVFESIDTNNNEHNDKESQNKALVQVNNLMNTEKAVALKMLGKSIRKNSSNSIKDIKEDFKNLKQKSGFLPTIGNIHNNKIGIIGSLSQNSKEKKLKSFTLQSGVNNTLKAVRMFKQKQKGPIMQQKIFKAKKAFEFVNPYKMMGQETQNMPQKTTIQEEIENANKGSSANLLYYEFDEMGKKQGEYNLDQFIVTNKMRRGIYEIEELYRKFFCEFDQKQEFHYFLIHNNLGIILKNYLRQQAKKLSLQQQQQQQQYNEKRQKIISNLNINLNKEAVRQLQSQSNVNICSHEELSSRSGLNSTVLNNNNQSHIQLNQNIQVK